MSSIFYQEKVIYFFTDVPLYEFTQSEQAIMEVLCLPIEPLIEEEDILSVVEAIREFLKRDSK